MSLFVDTPSVGENAFIKHKPEMLNGIYNTTDIFPYWVADMDFQVAKPISDELNRLVERGVYSYEFQEKSIFTALANWYKTRHNLDLDESKFIQVPGVLSGLALLIRQYSEKGDAVLIHTPAYHQFSTLISKADRKVVKSELKTDGFSYTIDFEDYENKIIKENIKVIIFCNPHNPTGRVWTKQELARLIEISARHNVLIISDEIHSDIIYSGNTFTSLTSFDYDNVIALIGSPAKTFGMHSISNGYVYTNNSNYHTEIHNLVSAMYLDHGNALSANATLAAFTQGEQWLDGMLQYLQQTNQWISDFLSENAPEIKMYKPEGTYQIWFDFSGLNLSEEQLKTLIFKQAKMGLTPGRWFGADNYNLMRMNIATSRDNIITSFSLLKDALNNLNKDDIAISKKCVKNNVGSCC